MGRHIHQSISLKAGRKEILNSLITPSSIIEWWGASDAIILPQTCGLYAVRWGDRDDLEYLSIASISEFKPDESIILSEYKYDPRKGGASF